LAAVKRYQERNREKINAAKRMKRAAAKADCGSKSAISSA
jgi:hypothetical protein